MIGVSPHNALLPIPRGPELNGGILVFFPSYGVLESVRKRWVESGLWTKLFSTVGHIVVESKQSQNGDQNINPQNSAAASKSSSSVNSNPSAEAIIAEFESALSDTKGKCILLAVCR